MRLVFFQEVVYLLKCGQKVSQTSLYLRFIFFLQAFFKKFKANEKFSDCKRKFSHGEIIT